MDGKDALAIFRPQSIALVNLLNLQVHKANPQPWFLAEDENLQIMRAVWQKNHAGKEAISEPTDLSNCDAFQICGKKRVFSMPHRDHHGVITTIFCDDGYKAWLMWPHLTPEQIEQWSDSIPVTHLDLDDRLDVRWHKSTERATAKILKMEVQHEMRNMDHDRELRKVEEQNTMRSYTAYLWRVQCGLD
ncbi:hypothetical protein LTR93_000567 [Exophiala xenobiotica]|nr:hypothetical protein LTR93_000567 [Exophiala xenobiotica]